MRDILVDVQRWLEEGRSVALATVVQTWGSSPRGVGSKMAMTLDGNIAGSVSGGCVENAVIEAGMQSLETNHSQLLHFGVADETAWDVGLACGGSIDVFVKALDHTFFEQLRNVVQKEQPVVTLTVVRGTEEIFGREFLMHKNSRFEGGLGNGWDEQVADLAKVSLLRGTSQRIKLDDELEVFFDVILPPPTLGAVGGAHITLALTALAKTLGYRTVVIDPRRVWGNQERFQHVDHLIQAWPDDAFSQVPVTESTAIATLTHDPKLDDPALAYALSSPAFYVGALGSASTNAKRRERLSQAGLSEAQLSRLHAPIGLDIGAESPEEIALAVMAEVVEAYRKWRRFEVEHEAVLHPGND